MYVIRLSWRALIRPALTMLTPPLLASPPATPPATPTRPPTDASDARVQRQLHAIESTLTDTVHLGEAMLTEFAQQTETFERAQNHTTGVVREAQTALHVVRAMRSTPYALWRWCVGWWTWLAGWLVVATEADPLPITAQAAREGTRAPPSGDTATDITHTPPLLPAHVERQLDTLQAQAHALGEALDTHLHLLDRLETGVATGGAALEAVPFDSAV